MSSNHSILVAQPAAQQDENLTRVLKPIHLWSLAVGLVISGNYFGWSYGFAAGGVMGLALALIPVTIFYVTFILSYSELATAIPHAGGPSAYARRAMGKFGGYLNGISCLIEFVFAPPAIALAVGGYVHALIPAVDPMVATVAAFFSSVPYCRTSSAFTPWPSFTTSCMATSTSARLKKNSAYSMTSMRMPEHGAGNHQCRHRYRHDDLTGHFQQADA